MAIQLPKKLTDAVGFIDGIGMAGRFNEVTLPDLDFVIESASGGGLGGNVPISMHKVADMMIAMKSDGVTSDLTASLGLPNVPFTVRSNATDGAENYPVLVQTRGLFNSHKLGSMGGENATGEPEYGGHLTYYKVTIGGVEICEIDIENRVCRIHGVDRWAGVNANLGV